MLRGWVGRDLTWRRGAAEWERLRDPNFKPDEPADAPHEATDITRNKREFTALIRTEIFRFLRPLVNGDYEGAVANVAGSDWTGEALGDALDPFYEDHELIRLDAEGRNGRHTFVEPLEEGCSWRVCQVLADPEGHNDWQCVFRVDLSRAREEGKPVLELEAVGPIGFERGAFS